MRNINKQPLRPPQDGLAAGMGSGLWDWKAPRDIAPLLLSTT